MSKDTLDILLEFLEARCSNDHKRAFDLIMKYKGDIDWTVVEDLIMEINQKEE